MNLRKKFLSPYDAESDECASREQLKNLNREICSDALYWECQNISMAD